MKAQKLAPIVRGWRNYHRYCQLNGSRFSLWQLNHRTYKVFLKEKKVNRQMAANLVKKAFPPVPYSENGVAELSYESVRNRHFLKLQIMN
ncbi:group II intron maturase-specific domain-containing protein [Microcystis aeruginosa]|uniref:group II intron maturase-specific domain-containing protein n=1 Tax=Microcystis aeruginosa TaxID=1126 RepID=UPI0040409BE6